jgi:hypothetical protein
VITSSQFTDLLETPPPRNSGMRESLAPNEVTSMNGKVDFSQLVNPCSQLSSRQPRLADTKWYYQPPEVLIEISFQKEAPYWRTPLYSFGPFKGYIQKVTHPQVSWYHQLPVVVYQNSWLPIHRFAGATSPVWWHVRTTGWGVLRMWEEEFLRLKSS